MGCVCYSGADTFVKALAGVFAVVLVESLGKLFAVFFVFDGLDQHFGRKPVLFEDVVAGADVNALFEFEHAALVVEIRAGVGHDSAVQKFKVRQVAAFPAPAFRVCVTDLRLAIENRFHGI